MNCDSQRIFHMLTQEKGLIQPPVAATTCGPGDVDHYGFGRRPPIIEYVEGVREHYKSLKTERGLSL